MKCFQNGSLKAVTFSYDDGVTQDIRLINLLNKYNLKCTFNINSERLGKRGILQRENQPISHYKIHPEDVKRVYEGHEIASHTLSHPNLTTLSEEDIIREVETDRQNLSILAGYEVMGFAYPCGGVNNDDRVAKIIRENTCVRYCRTITSNYDFSLQNNLYRFNPSVYHLEFDKMMELGEKFLHINPTERQIFYIWGHSYEMDYNPENWLRLEAFFEMISFRDDIFYGTNKEVLL